MRVFVTGASGFIGSAVVNTLIKAGHQVIGLARNEESARKIKSAGADVLIGNLEDADSQKRGTSLSDGVIHTAFIHDFTQYAKANEIEKAAINIMAETLLGTDRPIVLAAGILGLPLIEGLITEESVSQHPLRTSEPTALEWAQKGVRASVVRLPPSVHDKDDKGFMPFIIQQARKNGTSAYPDEGTNRWPAIHRLDAASVFRLALEKSAPGALYNAVGETGIKLKEIASVVGEALNLPVRSVRGEEQAKHFEWMNGFIGFDSPASSASTQQKLGWEPKHIGLLEDLKKNYF